MKEKRFTLSEVAEHATQQSCWVVLYGKVYDVTSLLSSHPGGAQAILRVAGQDATEDFDPIHPSDTLEGLEQELYIGSLDPEQEPTISSTSKRAPPIIPLHTLLNLDEIESAAETVISNKAWAYYYSAADDKITKEFNTQVYRSILLRPRIFVDCQTCNLDTHVLGHKVNMPVYVSPTAMARLGHPAGERGIAEACQAYGALQIIANNSSMSPEEIVAGAAPDQVFGWQLYVQRDWTVSERMLERVNRLPQIKFIVLTLDAPVSGKREDDERVNMKASPVGSVSTQLFAGTDPSLTWDETLRWLARHTDKPVVLKGLQTHEDALRATRYAPFIKGIILSNHGGRSLDTAPPAVHTLLEIHKFCPDVFSRLDVWVDGGILRGTDVVKALCLGAKAVGIGRPALWGLAAGGREGVERTLQILSDEIQACMRLLGANSIGDLGPHFINTRAVQQQIYDGPSLGTTHALTKGKL